MSVIAFQPRDLDIIRALSLRVRRFGELQLANAEWRGDRANARRRLRRLDDRGVVKRQIVMAKPVAHVKKVFEWEIGCPQPDFGELSYRVRARWTPIPIRQTICYIATDRGCALFGGPSRCGTEHPLQATHDLALAQAWLDLRRERPELATLWRGEDTFAADFVGMKRPDAILFDANGQPRTVVECVGGYGYDPPRLKAFHDFCSRTLQLPYWLYG